MPLDLFGHLKVSKKKQRQIFFGRSVCPAKQAIITVQIFYYFFYHNMDLKDVDSEYLFWLFPLWFQGTDRDKEDYYGLFPLWGEVHDIFGYDEVKFKFFHFR